MLWTGSPGFPGLVWFSFFHFGGSTLTSSVVVAVNIILCLGHAAQHVGFYFPDQGLNPGPLHWECEVLSHWTTRESPTVWFKNVHNSHLSSSLSSVFFASQHTLRGRSGLLFLCLFLKKILCVGTIVDLP